MSEFGRLHRPSRRIVLSLQSRYLCLSTQPPTAPLCNHHPRGRSDPFRSHRTHPIPKTGFGPVRSPALVSSLIVDPFCVLDLVSSLIGFGTATQKLTNPHPDLHHTYAMARHGGRSTPTFLSFLCPKGVVTASIVCHIAGRAGNTLCFAV